MSNEQSLTGEDSQSEPELSDVRAYLQSSAQGSTPSRQAREAWEAFYRGYSRLIRNQVDRCHVQAADADDLVQEAWAALVTHLSELKGDARPEQLRAWVVQVVHNKAADLLRSRAHHPAGSLEGSGHGSREPAAPGEGPAESEEQDRLLARLRKALVRLHGGRGGRNFIILAMRHFGNMSIKKIAARLGRTAGQVRDGLRRALGKLRRQLGAGPNRGSRERGKGRRKDS